MESDPTKLIRDRIQAHTPRILTLKINQGTKSGTLKKPMFSLFDVIIFLFDGMKKQNIKCFVFHFKAFRPVNNNYLK